MVGSKFLDLVPVSRRILFQSAELRFVRRRDHGKKLKLPDAIHLATAIQRGCRYFVSADTGIRLPAGIEMINPNIDGLAQLQRVFA
jgi:predicted nucleic acid-binding protein